MPRKRSPGLQQRGPEKFWHIDKIILGIRVCKSTGTGDLTEAEKHLARVADEIRQAQVYGIRPKRTFDQAAAKFIRENGHKRSIRDDVLRLDKLMPYIGHLPLEQIHMGTLQPFIDARRGDGVAVGTINHGLKVARHILNLAAGEWIDESGLSWLVAAPKIKLIPDQNKRKPSPFTWEEQDRLFRELPVHLANMALFAVNTGCRDSEVCRLRWTWEARVPELDTSVFILPEAHTKNGQERIVLLNRVAQSLVDSLRGQHPEYVFTFRGKPICHMTNTAWRRARTAVGLSHKRVHDLRHSFGARLRAAGVGFEDRQDLLGHKSTRMTTHYSAPEIGRLLEAVERICERDKSRPTGLVMVR